MRAFSLLSLRSNCSWGRINGEKSREWGNSRSKQGQRRSKFTWEECSRKANASSLMRAGWERPNVTHLFWAKNSEHYGSIRANWDRKRDSAKKTENRAKEIFRENGIISRNNGIPFELRQGENPDRSKRRTIASLLSEEVKIERTEATEDEEGCVSIEKFEIPKRERRRGETELDPKRGQNI